MVDLKEIVSWGFFGIFVSSCLLYLVPFIGPSTMIYAGAMAVIYPTLSPILIGIAVAAGASIGKGVHYYVSHFARRALGEKSIHRLEDYYKKWGRWKSVAIFIASATPVPDEPVLISIALVNYSPLRFLLVFFIGKLVVTIPGAYFGRSASHVLLHVAGEVPVAIASIIFTIIVTVFLIKVDPHKLWKRLTRKEGNAADSK
jgi:uncharacterized membrane protein YdjX (TVP38/TMEM64 family)